MTHLWLFVPAALTLIAIPGPNHLYIVARSIGEGRRAGIASALGVETGTMVHIGAAAAGLSALVAASATAFNALRYLGAGYLIYLAIRTFRSRDGLAGARLEPRPLRRVYLDGMLVNVLNPKVILFFLAFLPQFVDQRAGAVPGQIVVMGLVLAILGLASDIAYALAAGSLGEWLRARPGFQRRQRHATSLVYLLLGAAVVFTGPGHRAMATT